MAGGERREPPQQLLPLHRPRLTATDAIAKRREIEERIVDVRLRLRARQRAEERQRHYWQHVAMQWQQKLPPPIFVESPPSQRGWYFYREPDGLASDGHGGVYDAAAPGVGAPDELGGAADWEEEEEEEWEEGGEWEEEGRYTSKPGWPPMDHDDECGPLDGGGSTIPFPDDGFEHRRAPQYDGRGGDDDGSGEWDGGGSDEGWYGGASGVAASGRDPRQRPPVYWEPTSSEPTGDQWSSWTGGERPTVWGAFGHPTIEALEGARGAARVAAAWQLAAHAPRAAWPGEHPDGHRQIYVERPHSPLDMGTRRGVDGGDDGGVDGRAAAEAALREAFAFFDRSGRGRLTPDDLWTGMRALGYQLSMDEAWQIFEGVALPHSREAGTIGVGEFRQLLRGSVGAMGGQTGGFGAMSSPDQLLVDTTDELARLYAHDYPHHDGLEGGDQDARHHHQDQQQQPDRKGGDVAARSRASDDQSSKRRSAHKAQGKLTAMGGPARGLLRRIRGSSGKRGGGDGGGIDGGGGGDRALRRSPARRSPSSASSASGRRSARSQARLQGNPRAGAISSMPPTPPQTLPGAARKRVPDFTSGASKDRRAQARPADIKVARAHFA